jgi:hypothetical protein
MAISAAHLVAISALIFCASAALTLINVVRHFDQPETPSAPEQTSPVAKVA